MNLAALKVLVDVANRIVVRAGVAGIEARELFIRVASVCEVSPALLAMITRKMFDKGAWKHLGGRVYALELAKEAVRGRARA